MDARPAVPQEPPELPTVYMLCGFVGAGKTTYARRLEAEGCVRLSLDEYIFGAHGAHGVDYDEGDYPRYESEARADLDGRLLVLLDDGSDVVLDYGFWSHEQRDRCKRLIEEAGARWSCRASGVAHGSVEVDGDGDDRCEGGDAEEGRR
jgi:predicted kinase